MSIFSNLQSSHIGKEIWLHCFNWTSTRKPDFVECEQQRHRPACVSTEKTENKICNDTVCIALGNMSVKTGNIASGDDI